MNRNSKVCRHSLGARRCTGLPRTALLLLLIGTLGASSAGCAPPADLPTKAPTTAPSVAQDQGEVCQRVRHQLSWTQRRRFDFLETWPTDALVRLDRWLALGFTLEGPWRSTDLMLLLDILDAFGNAYGPERFTEIVGQAVVARSDGRRQQLRLVRETSYALPAAAWYARSGRIVLNDGIFDPQFVHDHYYWDFLLREYADPGPGIRFEHVVIGHEFGHVLIDGLRVEAAAIGHGDTSPEGLYSKVVPAVQWAHRGARTNENLATELAVFALGVERTSEVDVFRSGFLTQTTEGADWPQALVGGELSLTAFAGR